MNIALVGNPNSGKTTLLNALLDARESTGNWSGVTVEKKTGTFFHQNVSIHVTDLPGIYNLTLPDACISPDEKVTNTYLAEGNVDLIIHVIDASMLERSLYLTSQILEREIPVIIALNKMDLIKKKSWKLDVKKLGSLLGCPVVPLKSQDHQSLLTLKNQLLQQHLSKAKPIRFPSAIENTLQWLESKRSLPESFRRTTFLSWLENPENTQTLSSDDQKTLETAQQMVEQEAGVEADVIIASARYEYAQEIANQVLSMKTQQNMNISEQLDRIFLNRILGIPLFLGVMYVLFFFSIHLGKLFQEAFELLGETVFVNGSAYWLNQMGMPKWSIALISQGLGKGVNTLLSFIPVLSALFLSLSFLEMSGYMARAAFIMDRLMRMIGLSGKSFIPLMIGFGCNVPAIMAARTLSDEKDRILTIMMTPFMSCSARLAIYSIFVIAFFPSHGTNIIFLLYLIGIGMALLTAWLLKHRIKQNTNDHTLMEMPAYHLPAPGILVRTAFHRLKGFILQAGVIIVPVSMVIYLLNAITLDGQINLQGWHPDSILAAAGKALTPLFHPMGIQEENWPATVGLLSGVLAKEVVIGTLNTLYAQTNVLMHNALHTTPPSIMQQRFDGAIGAFAYLLFTLLYMPCMSTFAAIAKELNRKWALISILWSTSLAYTTAVLFYQIATMPLHAATSWAWILASLLLLTGMLLTIRKMVPHKAAS